jgi:tetratricopeptide (TPR) repeat protein
VTELLARVAHLALLVLAPGIFSPEPVASPAWLPFAGVAVLVAPLAFAFWLVRRFEVLEAKAALALWVLADGALIRGAHSTLAAGLPLLGGYYLAAPFFWAGLGAVFATLAGQYLGTSFKNKRMGAFFIAVAAGIFGFRDAHGRIASRSLQWRAVLDVAPAHEQALRALEGELSRDTESPERLVACIARRPDACLCRTLLAERSLRAGRAHEARSHSAAGACAGHPLSSRAAEADARATTMLERHEAAQAHAALAFAADREGRYEEARREYGEALALEPERADDHHRLVMLHWREGAKGEARAEAKRFAERFPRDGRNAELRRTVGESR